MRIEFKKSFKRAIRKYSPRQRQEIFNSIQTLIESMERFQIPKGLGLRLLIAKSRIWELRVTAAIRILFRYEEDLLEFGYVGSHDEIKRYLKIL
ncbi:MAG: hypothetical protein NC920_02280 [Candidatus Omnitrophica bacterium]|nr:hypothetical protein [Candidatus Omnitrophota bacterium]MCM8798154.1 hypothetical protein [Candidatus Omnitrophota bacterium]